MENVIFANGFEEYVEGVKQCPPKNPPSGELNSQFVQWCHLDQMILSWLYSTLTQDIMSQIIGSQSSHEAWVDLQRIFSASSKARVMQLRLEYQMTNKDGNTMAEYVLKMKTIANNLADIDEHVKERDQILPILGGLGLEYNSIVASLTTREDDLSLHFVRSILLTHEQRLQLQHAVPTDLTSVTAHLAASSIHLSSSMHNRRSEPRSTPNEPSSYRSYRPNLPKQSYSGHHQRQAVYMTPVPTLENLDTLHSNAVTVLIFLFKILLRQLSLLNLVPLHDHLLACRL